MKEVKANSLHPANMAIICRQIDIFHVYNGGLLRSATNQRNYKDTFGMPPSLLPISPGNSQQPLTSQ